MSGSRLLSFADRTRYHREHPAQSQRRIIGALSGLVFAGMLVGVSASERAVATEIVSESPQSPGAARVVLVDDTTTTSAAPTEAGAVTTVLVTDPTVAPSPEVLGEAPSPRSGPSTTVRRGSTTSPPSGGGPSPSPTPGGPSSPSPTPSPTPWPTPTSPPATNPPVTNPPVTSPPTTTAAPTTTTAPPPTTTEAPDPPPEPPEGE